MKPNLKAVEPAFTNKFVFPGHTAHLTPSASSQRPTLPMLGKLGIGSVAPLSHLVAEEKLDGPTQIVVAELSWRKGWLTKARRSILEGIIEYENRYLRPVGGGATIKFVDGGIVVVISNPWHVLFCCHQRLENWGRRQGCNYTCVELTQAA